MAGTEKSTLILGQLNIIVKVCLSKKTANSHFQYVRVHVTHIDIYIYMYIYIIYILFIFTYIYIYIYVYFLDLLVQIFVISIVNHCYFCQTICAMKY